MNHQWYYAKNGQQSGPVTMEELKNLISNGTLDESADLVWREGMPSWVTPDKVPDLSMGTPAASAAAQVSASAPPSFAAPAQGAYVAQQSQMPMSGYDVAPIELPPVKPANFSLLAICYVLGLIMFTVSFGILLGPFFMDVMNNPEKYNVPNPLEPDIDASPGLLFAMLGGLGLLVFGAVLSFVYLYRAWAAIRPWTKAATPGTAVGFLFIPFFNIYWQFVAWWKWSVEWNRIVASNPRHANAPRMSEGLFLAYPIVNLVSGILSIFGIIPVVIVFLIVSKKMCDAINYAAATGGQQGYR